MNYRRGFQRLYSALTVAWVVALLFILPTDRVKFWSVAGKGTSAPVDLSQYGTVTPAPQSKGGWGANDVALGEANTSNIDKLFDQAEAQEKAEAATRKVETRTQRVIWIAGILFGPPALGYAAFFFVIPWIYRGFQPTKQAALPPNR